MENDKEIHSTEHNIKDLLSGKIPWEPTDIEIANEIISTLGISSKCLKNPCLALDNAMLILMLKKQSNTEKKRLLKYLYFFRTYMEPLFIFTQEKNGKAYAFHENRVRSSLALHVIFSIIEKQSKKEKRKDFTTFLKEHIEEIKTPANIDKLSDEHQKLSPGGNVGSVKKFYSQWLSDQEKDGLVKDYEGGKWSKEKRRNFATEQIIGDIYGSMRSAFSHSLGTRHLRKDSHTLVWGNTEKSSNLIAVYTDISIDHFLALSWIAILRSFGYLPLEH